MAQGHSSCSGDVKVINFMVLVNWVLGKNEKEPKKTGDLMTQLGKMKSGSVVFC